MAWSINSKFFAFSIIIAGVSCFYHSFVFAESLSITAPKVKPDVIEPSGQTLDTGLNHSPAASSTDAIQFPFPGIRLENNFIEPGERYHEILNAFSGQQISFADLQQLVDALNQHYHQQGYPLVRVVIPPQTVSKGQQISLKVIDGRINQITLSGVPKHLKKAVLARVSSLEGKARLTRRELERRIMLAREIAGIELNPYFRMSNLSRAANDNTSRVELILETEQYQAYRASMSADNSLSKELGDGQYIGSFSMDSVLGYGESLYIGAILPTDAYDTRHGGFLGTRIPLGNDGAAVELDTLYIHAEPTGELDNLALEDTYRRTSIELSYPLLLSFRQDLSVQLGLSAIEEKNTALGGLVTLSEDHLTIASLGLEHIHWFTDTSVVSSQLRLNKGVAGRSQLKSRAQGDEYYHALNLDTLYSHHLGLNWWAFARASMQYTPSTLLDPVRYAISGPNRLSGFDSGALIGDKGWFGRLQLEKRMSWLSWLFSPYVFYGAGSVKNNDPTALELDLITADSYGIGINLTNRSLYKLDFTLNAEYAWGKSDDLKKIGENENAQRGSVSAAIHW